MGAAGLTRATAVAVLSANYIATRLGEHFPVLYRGHGGLVAHECILDLRGLTKDTGVTVDDVAKRLVDYGFHAPTMSFPVAGTLMVEPTESEDLAEIDRFCDAMIAIRAEIDQVGAGEWTPEDSPLRGAPHTARALRRASGTAPTRASSRSSRPASTPTSTGRRWPGSTRRTATATWSARARRRRRSPSAASRDSTSRRLQAWLATAQAQGRLPSVVAGLVRDGEPVWFGSYGDAGLPGHDPLDVQYRIGSITKTMTAVLVLQLAATACSTWTSRRRWCSVTSATPIARVRSLLAHSSGMQSEPVGSWWERSAGLPSTSWPPRTTARARSSRPVQ